MADAPTTARRWRLTIEVADRAKKPDTIEVGFTGRSDQLGAHVFDLHDQLVAAGMRITGWHAAPLEPAEVPA